MFYEDGPKALANLAKRCYRSVQKDKTQEISNIEHPHSYKTADSQMILGNKPKLMLYLG